MTDTDHPHQLTLTAYPLGPGPFERWELTVGATGEVLLKGDMPLDEEAVRQAVREYHVRTENEARLKAAEERYKRGPA